VLFLLIFRCVIW